MTIHDEDDAQRTFLPNARHSIDLSIDLEHQLTYLESQPNTPADALFAPNANPQPGDERKRESLDPHVLASIIMQLRQSLGNMTKERDDLLAIVSTANANEARLTDALQLTTDKCATMEEELTEARRKIKDDEDAIAMLRSKVEESRRGLMRLQTESRRQSTVLAAPDMGRATSTPLASKRASFTPLSLSSPSSFTPLKNAHRRISSASDSGSLLGGDLRNSPHSQQFPFNEPDQGSRRQSMHFGRSPPRMELMLSPPDASIIAEVESLRAEIKTLKNELEEARLELGEAFEARDASDTCVKALREFIAENNVGTPEQPADLKPPPVPASVAWQDPASKAAPANQGWGFKLWNTKATAAAAPAPAAAPPVAAPPAAVTSPESSTAETASISRKLGGFFSSRASVSSTNSSNFPTTASTTLLRLDTARTRDSSASDMSSVADSLAEPISPLSRSGDVNANVLVRDLTSISLGDAQEDSAPAKTLPGVPGIAA
ncbi:hypothetical protein BDN71DRAFT_1503174 [Pleurotus eryngii]|uniref:Uncharacterized protein n=1 Tax=Pleurotus eryngii TaxID=5323 RepID=A0A9P6A579_PLEER|nr:hypothetical protein BDN71DRAFT_1503174 [Pleurotus eryngii]